MALSWLLFQIWRIVQGSEKTVRELPGFGKAQDYLTLYLVCRCAKPWIHWVSVVDFLYLAKRYEENGLDDLEDRKSYLEISNLLAIRCGTAERRSYPRTLCGYSILLADLYLSNHIAG